jgi:hypothetical protein
MAQMSPPQEHFRRLLLTSPPEHEFPNDVEAVYECERMMSLPAYRQLPLDEQAELAHTREQILRSWQAGAPLASDDFSAPHDDRFLRYKFNMLKSLWAQYKGEPLPENGRARFS